MKKVFLVGCPVSHSMSPRLLNAAFRAANLAWEYELLETPTEKLGEAVTRLRKDDCGGANVTVPHKQSVLPLLDATGFDAARVGAVNTIVKMQGKLVGENTDIQGFLQSLADFGISPIKSTAAIFGAGGAAHAAAFGLAREQAAKIVIINRTAARAVSLAEALLRHHPTVQVRINSTEELAQADIIVNATSVGMETRQSHPLEQERRGEGALGKLPYPLLAVSRIKRGAIVLDMVYRPRETRLLIEARANGAVTIDGLHMLVHQGRAAFKLWTGIDAPEAKELYAEISDRG